jgi:taurine dioxygenase
VVSCPRPTGGYSVRKDEIRVTPLSSVLGARVEGIELTKLHDANTLRAIRTALLEHLVLVFPGQPLTPEEQRSFAGKFARPEPHPVTRFFGGSETIVSIDNELIAPPDRAVNPHLDHLAEHGAWHTDYTFSPKIPEFATLRAEVVPPVGGDTLWSNMVAAYEALSPVVQELLAGLNAVHWHGPHFARNFGVERFGDDAEGRFEKAFPAVEHPMVITHPESGRRSLFVNPSYTARIPAMMPAESEATLRFLFQHVTKPAFHFRHHWRKNDLILWDERATLHLAPTDFLPHRRKLVRVAVGSVVPTR